MTAKEGLDGSGQHAVYDQLSNVQTHNIRAVGTHIQMIVIKMGWAASGLIGAP